VRTWRGILVVVVAALALPLVFNGTATAVTTINVTTANDVVNNADGVTSLREAISLANLVGGDTVIQLSASATLSSCDGAGDDNTNVGGDLDYVGAGPLAIRATAAGVVISGQQTCAVKDDRILDLRSAAVVTVSSAVPGSPITFQQGTVAGNGGAIRSAGTLVVDNATFSSNTATGNGGAVAGAAVSFTDAVVTTNSSSAGDGGGIHATGATSFTRTTVSSNTANNGGGVFASGALTSTTSTFNANTAGTAGGGISGASGISLTNSTVWANTSVEASLVGVHRGGGIDAPTGGVTLSFATIGMNRALTGGANISTGGTLTSFASVISRVAYQTTGSSCSAATTVSNGYNLDESTSCGFGAGAGDGSGLTNVVESLAANGGPTSTVSPFPGSLAIDRVPPATPGCSGTDQRGTVRPQGSGCDSGAYEAAAPIVVTTTADVVNAGDGLLSLREALTLANTQPGVDRLALAAAATYPITRCGVEALNVSGSLDARDLAGVTLQGVSSTIDNTCGGTPEAAVLAGGLGLMLDGVSVDHASGAGLGYGSVGFGGLITLKNAQIRNSGGDGVNLSSNSYTLVMRNAAVTNSHGVGIMGSTIQLDMADSEVANSQALGYPFPIPGAGNVGSALVVGSNIHDNAGGLYVGGSLTATGSHFDHNNGRIGGAFGNPVIATDTTFDGNTTTSPGGGAGLITSGTSTLTRVSISNNSSPLNPGLVMGGPVTIIDSHLDNNVMTGPGGSFTVNAGAIFNYVTGCCPSAHPLTISGSTINGNSAPGWAAIASNGALTLTNSTVAGNISAVAPPSSSTEATVWVTDANVTVSGSTISGNAAPTTTPAGTGGVFVNGSVTSSLTLQRSTVTGNTGKFGGVVMNNGFVLDSTIASNGAPAGGVANLLTQGTVTIGRSAIASPVGAASCAGIGTLLYTNGFNFDSGNTCNFTAPTDIVNGGDPLLGALADNGGATQTLMPQIGSPLVNHIPSGDPGCTGVDQRGVSRPQGPACDIGAVEVDGADVAWATSAGGTGSDLARNVRVDASGNSYVVGTITGSVTFGSGASAVNVVAQGTKDGFLAKYLPDGTLSWVKRIGGASSDEAWGLALDPAGNPVVTGVFDGSVSFSLLNILNGTNDMFVAKYSTAGVLSWVRAGTGPDWEQGLSVSVDPAGNVFVGGVYASAAASFGPAPNQSLANQGSLDGFVARYGPNGGLWWVNSMAGPGQDFLTGVAARPDGSVAVTGTIDQPARFGVGGSFLPTYGSNDAFVALFNAGGATNWAAPVGGTGSDLGWSIATDAAGEIYVAGAFSGTATAGAFTATSAGSLDAFVARFAGTGSALWLRRAGGAGADFGLGVAVDGGNVHLTGSLMGAGTFGAFTVGSGNGFTPADGYLARLGTDGTWVWAQKLVSGPGTDYGLAVAATSAGVWVTGNFVGSSATIGHGAGALTITGAGSDDLFLTRFNP
jgi:predicted outer membrane repeat protein